MCGRYTIIDLSRFTDLFPWIRQPETTALPRYNVCPSQEIPIVANTPEPRIDFAQWGLVPSWGPAGVRPLINARAETLATKRTFKDAFRKRRCLIPADGFYEWKTSKFGERCPIYYRLKSHKPFAFAGFWEPTRVGGDLSKTATIITTNSNSLIEPIHDRMPVILMEEDYQCWLDATEREPDDLLSMLKPFPAEEMEALEVSKLVNSPKNEGPECIEPDKGSAFETPTSEEDEPGLFQ
ncbi:MAG TPA: SOS response-associated peptidase [Tepidisphaeraceae bacterium]|nr:SOS response-associated peptidase [Tepidisphaeraceae bacterium]